MMKKKLITLAVLAAAGSASAQSSVTIYGAIDNSFTRVTNNKGGASASGLSSGGGGSVGSKLGFKGSEDLGGGLKVNFKLELGLETSSGANGVPGSNNNIDIIPPGGALRFDRAAYVSLSGAYGEIRVGRDLAASFISNVIYDPFLTYGVGSSLNFPLGVLGSLFVPAGVLSPSITGKDAASLFRVSNAISYFTPGDLGGFSGQFQFAPSEQSSNAGVGDKDGRVIALRLAFDKGPIGFSVSAGKSTQSGVGVSQDVSTANVGGSYDFGVAKVTAEYVRFETENATGVVGQDFNTKVATIGVIAPLGPGRIKLGLSASERDVDGIASDFNANKIALGYDYVLSKRTSLFVTVARVNNSGGSAVGVADGGVAGFGSPTRVNSRSVGYDVGILHSF